MPTVSRSLRARRTTALLGTLALLLSSAGLVEARGAPGWLTRLFNAATGRSAPMAVGDTVIVYGPKMFALGANSTSGTFVEQFTAPAGLTGAALGRGFVLRVQNGYNGKPAITSGTFKLNGVTVSSGSFANLPAGQTVDLPIAIQLTSGDVMQATLQGPRSAAIRMTILAVPDPTFAVFGPKLYTRASGGAVTVTNQFTLPAGTSTPRYLCFRNGDVDGTHKNSSVTVRLNNVEILGSSGLNGYVAPFCTTVTMLASNTLAVKLMGVTGSHFTVTATATDAAAPKVAITAPLPNFTTRQTTLTAVGTVTDQTAVTVTVNGVAATLTAGTLGQTSFTATVPLTTEGNNTVLVHVVDAAGNVADSTRVVIRDTEAPVVVLNGLPDSAVYRSDSLITVTGTVTDRTKITANLNGQALVVDTTTHAFSKTIRLGTGVNFLTLTATDAAGNVTTVVRQVTVDNTPPTLTVTAPAEGGISSAGTAHITGTVTAFSPASLTINGAPVTLGTGGVFAADIAVAEGDNTITVVATNASGIATMVTRHVVRDTQAPALVWDAPLDNAVTSATSVPVSGSVTDRTAIMLMLNGSAVAVDANTGAFTSSLPLADEGVATLTLVATDAAGNITTATRTVTRDVTGPVIALNSPADGLSTDAQTILVQGTATDRGVTSVTVNGQTASLGAGGSFSLSVPLVEGANVITIAARDDIGNQSTTTRTVSRLSATTPEGFTEAIPIDRSLNAPAPQASRVSTIGNSTEFLYKGANAVQHDVAEGAISPVRAAVIRGRLVNRGNTPMPGVLVKIANHPELGWTMTRANGVYDLAVAGGGIFVVQFTKDGYFPVTRDVPTLFNEFSPIADVVLTAADTAATMIDFSAPIEVARGTPVQDASGYRQATLFFRQGTQATLVMPDGSTQPAPSITVRATEYTVGPLGEQAMPASLSPTTSYTYAAELSTDEATAVGAAQVRFSQPVISYTENFVGFPVGMTMPSGYYDRQSNSWKPEANGRVIQVLSTSGGVATVDVTGAGMAAGLDTLAALGIGTEELTQLAQLYQAGATLWRVPLNHFSAVDYNVKRVTPKGGKPSIPKKRKPKPKKPTCEDGSEINVEEQLLGESYALANTPFSLHYITNRTPGFALARTFDIPLTDDTLPEHLLQIVVEIEIGGRRLVREFTPATNITYRYTWDGLDAYGRQLNGPQLMIARVSYAYLTPYAQPAWVTGYSFDNPPVGTLPTPVPARSRILLGTEYREMLGAYDARADGFGGWSLDEHHVYDPFHKQLLRGDGNILDASLIGASIRRAIGNGAYGHGGDGGPALNATITAGGQMVGMPDGSMIFTDQVVMRQVDSAGTISTLNLNGMGPTGNIAAGPDGSLYFASGEGEYRRAPDGTITRIVGAPAGGGAFVEGARADEVRVFQPGFNVRAVSPDGTLHMLIGDKIWRLAKDDHLYRVAGSLAADCNAPVIEGLARDITICQASGMAIGRDGSIYLSEHNARWIRRIWPDGTVTKVTGGPGATTDYIATGPAINSQTYATWLTSAADGSLLVFEGFAGYLREITADGTIHRIAGNGNRFGGPVDGQLALTSPFGNQSGAAFKALDGSIYIPDALSPVINRIAPALPGLGVGDIVFPSEDGSELYVFDITGRHTRTRDAMTMRDRYRFAYDSLGRLRSVTDIHEQVTRIEPAADGQSAAIVSSHGVRTIVQFDANGFARRVQGPQGYTVTPTHDAGGLLTTFRDLRGMPHFFAYDSLGQLTRDADSLGAQSLLAYVTDTSKVVMHTNAVGIATTYSVLFKASDESTTQTTTRAGQAPDSVTYAADHGTLARLPAGTLIGTARSPDPRFGLPVEYTSAFAYQVAQFRSTVSQSRERIGGAADPLTATGLLLETTNTNGRVQRDSIDLDARLSVSRSSQGRRSAARYDTLGRTLESQSWSQLASFVSYDSVGQMRSVRTGGRIDSLSWDAFGRVASTRRPDGARITYERDSLGNVLAVQFADTLRETFTYDAANALTAATRLGGRRYTFTYNAQGLLANDSLASAELLLGRYTYDEAGRLNTITRPGRGSLTLDYDATGRVNSVTSPTLDTRMTYNPTNNLLATIGGNGQSYGIEYYGQIPVRINASGLVNGTIDYAYTADLWLSSMRIAGRAAIEYAYDADGVVTRGGQLVLTRDSVTGAIVRDTIGVVAATRSYDDHGALTGLQLRVSGQAVSTQRFEHDSLGRVLSQRDSSAGTTATTVYHYDVLDRLDQVLENGSVVQAFTYDAAGNRTTVATPTGIVSATYAPDDRVISVGGQPITHDAAGARAVEVRGTDTLRYQYDDLGRLTALASTQTGTLAVRLDAQGRRVQELRDGVVVRTFLYASGRMPVAEMTAAGDTRSEFVYVAGGEAPDYMLRDGRTYYLLHDQLGSVRQVIDVATGALVQALDYDVNGVIVRNTNLGFQPFGYAGGLLDLDGRTVHFGARDYDARTGRWLQPDAAGATGGRNRYEYAASDPINFVDYTGFKPCPNELAAIRKRIASVAQRIKEYKAAAEIGMSDATHLNRNIAEELRGLNRLVNKYYADGCDDDDDFRKMKRELKELHKPLPPPQLPENPWRKKFDKFCEDVERGADIVWNGFLDGIKQGPGPVGPVTPGGGRIIIY